MAEREPTNVSAAFDILLEAIEEEIEFVYASASSAALQRDSDQSRVHLANADNMTDFRGRIGQLRDEWNAAYGGTHEVAVDEEAERARRDLGRLKRGLRTPDVAFEVPIMQVLSEMGGSGATAEVIDRVGERMKDRLTDVDYERLPSPPHDYRWRNTAQWARFQLVQRGFLKDNSPRGTWELSDGGYQELERLRSTQDVAN